MDKNKMDLITRRHIWGVIYLMFLLMCILFTLFSQPSYTFWWWFTFSCVTIAISVGIADICYVYAKYLIHKTTSEE